VTYVGLFALGLAIVGKEASLSLVLSETGRLYSHHAVLTDMKHPLTSGWPTWVVPVRPLVLGFRSELGQVRALSSLGNLALWWAACGVALLCVVAILRQGLLATLRPIPDASAEAVPARDSTTSAPWPLEGFVLAHGRAVVLAIAGAAAFVSPWVLTHRDSYIYHFLPAYAVLLVLLGGYVGTLWPARPRAVLAYLAVVTVVAGWYAPVWSFLPLSRQSYEQRLPLENWR
jgi:dolichyl-phosphate-mannose--protein O-mannosyl transferase